MKSVLMSYVVLFVLNFMMAIILFCNYMSSGHWYCLFFAGFNVLSFVLMGWFGVREWFGNVDGKKKI